MCGIFGFITKDGRGPNLERLRRIAIQTQRRGQHAFGLAWVAADGRLHTFKRPGAASENLEDLERCAGAQVVIGHCRWATHGTPADNRNNHPHRAGRGWIVHNGIVRNHGALVRQHCLSVRTQCDSEVLGLLLAKSPGSLEERAARTAKAADGLLAILGVWANPVRLLIVRHGNPLWIGETRGGGRAPRQPAVDRRDEGRRLLRKPPGRSAWEPGACARCPSWSADPPRGDGVAAGGGGWPVDAHAGDRAGAFWPAAQSGDASIRATWAKRGSLMPNAAIREPAAPGVGNLQSAGTKGTTLANGGNAMPTHYVATLARYVLVEAVDEQDAMAKGRLALHELYADLREKLGRDVPIEIRTLRLATTDEMDMMKWHREMCEGERVFQSRQGASP
jgi:hypothetical protein